MDKKQNHNQPESLGAIKNEADYQISETDVLGLPSRKKIHQQKKSIRNRKINRIWLQCLFAGIIFLLLLFISFPYWQPLMDDAGTPLIFDDTPLHDIVEFQE